jgi:hypothetical protein
MNILEAILNAQGGASARQLGDQFGLDAQQTQSALGALMPALAGAVSQNAAKPGGLEGLLGALGGGQHAQYLDNPSTLADASTVNDGNGILGHLLGSKDASRAVASGAAARTGIGADVLKRMLPVVAAMVMGGLSKRSSAQGAGAAAGFGAMAPASSGGGLLGMLTPMLDRNNHGSAFDDIMKMASGCSVVADGMIRQ